ncbi:hypothetical protein RYZ26_08675 [Terasakiella sp. A23]|uniref:hypothetical protein n=1 Tax=Terasakiella sp. FCG-A23 TaxID=3080561 RepID=UPI002952C00E|nr:hypothetical protein [Terasakiella sp. A23]MDV7339664.1 hypothetical protein [Terasakiella sp. A23]
MALSVDAKVYGPLAVPKTPAPRTPSRPASAEGESTQRAAQAFVETLPPEVRERLAQAGRDGQKRDQFDNAQGSSDDLLSRNVDSDTGFDRPAFNPNAADQEPVYTAPILTPAATLLQAQLSDQEYAGSDAGLTSQQYEAYHDAYLSAGAQPGGRASALEAALVREEQAQKTLIVPPVLTQVNFVA